jgi:hypothetical protein
MMAERNRNVCSENLRLFLDVGVRLETRLSIEVNYMDININDRLV